MEWSEGMASGLGGIGGAIIGGVGSYLSGRSSAKANERMYKHRYQWQMKDMRKAGLNPMLAFSQGAPTAPAPHFPDMGASMTEGARKGSQSVIEMRLANSAVAKNAAEASKAIAEGNQANSAAKVNEAMIPEIAARTEHYGASARELGSRIQYQQALLPKITAEVENIKGDTAKKSWEVQKYKAEIRKIASEIGKNEAEIRWSDLNFHQKQRLFPLVESVTQSEAWLKRYQLPEAEYRYKFWRDESEGKDLGDYRWWKSMGTQMGPFSSAAGAAQLLR